MDVPLSGFRRGPWDRQREVSGIYAAMAANPEYAAYIERLTADHRQAEERLARLAALSGAQLAEEVDTLESELREHIIAEEWDLFPLTLVALSGSDWDAVIAVDDADPTALPGSQA